MQPTETILFSNHDASVDAPSAVRSQCLNYGWTVVIEKTGTDGNGKVLIEQSTDKVNWFPYIDKEICTEDGVIENSEILLDNDHTLITDEFFHGYYFRMSYTANGTSTGTINARLNEKIRG